MRLFVAILLPASIRPAISHAAEHLRDCMGVRLLPPDDWHITLRFIGDADEEKAMRIGTALSAVDFSPFAVRLSGAGAYPDTHFPRAIFVGGASEGAAALAAKVDRALAPFGLQNEKFSVHVTVARSKGAGDIDAFLKNAGDVGSFEVKSFALMKTTLMAHAAAYTVLGEYPARDGDG